MKIDLTIKNIAYTLCFLTRDNRILMLKRNNPPNKGLWNGVGGHLNIEEDPLNCVLREVKEETGFVIEQPRFCGLLTWEGFEIPSGGLYIFTANAPDGEPIACAEGVLEWKINTWVFSSPQVVSNIHVFGPKILQTDPPPPQRFHFQYRGGEIQWFKIFPLAQDERLGIS